MSVIHFEGWDFYNSLGPGGRKWDQASSGTFHSPGRFGGQSLFTGREILNTGTMKTLPGNYPELIVGFAMNVGGYFSAFNLPELPSHPFFVFSDGITPQCSLWIDTTTQVLQIRGGRGEPVGPVILSTSFVPPLTLWYYLEVKITFGSPGSVELMVDGLSLGTATGTTQQSANAYCNTISLNSYNNFSGGSQGGSWECDDLYVIDPNDATGSVDYLGEVRVQTKYPDAPGFQDDFLPSVGINNAANVSVAVTDYQEHGLFNYSGTVGAIDLYSIGNFTVSGEIFAVQENISFKKDDVGNRNVCPLLRTASQNYEGDSVPCFSSYTWTGKIWELDPATAAPWNLTNLNQADFGIKVKS